MVKQFVESIEGEVYVESELGKGTKFICIIPLRAALLEDEFGCEPNTNTKIKPFVLIKNQTMDDPVSVTAKIKNVAKVSTSTGEQTKILVVEDNLIAARVVKNTLSDLNCEVDIAENGNLHSRKF